MAVPFDPEAWLADRKARMADGLARLAKAARAGAIPGGSIENGILKLDRLSAAVPEEADEQGNRLKPVGGSGRDCAGHARAPCPTARAGPTRCSRGPFPAPGDARHRGRGRTGGCHSGGGRG